MSNFLSIPRVNMFRLAGKDCYYRNFSWYSSDEDVQIFCWILAKMLLIYRIHRIKSFRHLFPDAFGRMDLVAKVWAMIDKFGPFE